MSVMIVGFALLLGLLLVVVVNASGAYLTHRRLVSAADGAAAAAASGVDREAVYTTGLDGSESVPLSVSSARSAARDYLRTVGVDVDMFAVHVSDRRVHVRLSSTFRPRIAPPGWPGASNVVAESTARLHLAGR